MILFDGTNIYCLGATETEPADQMLQFNKKNPCSLVQIEGAVYQFNNGS
jgi:hypothetical protein